MDTVERSWDGDCKEGDTPASGTKDPERVTKSGRAPMPLTGVAVDEEEEEEE